MKYLKIKNETRYITFFDYQKIEKRRIESIEYVKATSVETGYTRLFLRINLKYPRSSRKIIIRSATAKNILEIEEYIPILCNELKNNI